MAKLSKKFSELNKGARKKLIKQYGSKSAAKAAHSKARTAAGKKKPAPKPAFTEERPSPVAPGVDYTPSKIFKGIDPYIGFRPAAEQKKAEDKIRKRLLKETESDVKDLATEISRPDYTPETPFNPTELLETIGGLKEQITGLEETAAADIERLSEGYEENLAAIRAENAERLRRMQIAQRVSMENTARAGLTARFGLGARGADGGLYGIGGFKRRRLRIKPVTATGLAISPTGGNMAQSSNKMLNV